MNRRFAEVLQRSRQDPSDSSEYASAQDRRAGDPPNLSFARALPARAGIVEYFKLRCLRCSEALTRAGPNSNPLYPQWKQINGAYVHKLGARGPRHNLNLSIGSRYLLGAIVLATLAMSLRPIGMLLLWPGASLAIVACGYFGLGATIYRKSNGQLPLVTKLMLWPALLGQHISLLYYRRQCDPWNVLTEQIWIGRKLNCIEAAQAVQAGVTAVLDLTGEFSESEPFRKLRYMQLPVLDLTAPTKHELNQAIDFIASNIGIVYIHCKIGYSRTAAIAGCYLLASGVAGSAEQAIAMLRSARPSIVIRPEAERAIRNFSSICVPPMGSHQPDARVAPALLIGPQINTKPPVINTDS